MRVRLMLAAPLLVALTPLVAAQTITAPPTAGPRFEVVSVKRNTTGTLGSTVAERPDGGFTMTNIPATLLIGRAYPVGVPADWIGRPEWTLTERWDVSATSPLPRPTAEERTAMMRALLADRFKLAVHVERREQPVYELVLARSDGALGPGLKKSAEDVDCVARAAAERAAAEAAAAAGQPPPPRALPNFELTGPRAPCSITVRGAELVAHTTLPLFANFLRGSVGRPVVDKTGLKGLYYVTMEYDRMAAVRGPEVAATPGAPPSAFTAVQEQLGLKLESTREMRDTLVIDRIERPTEN
jgi:uncharacterized protein (TIGR03435 family)